MVQRGTLRQHKVRHLIALSIRNLHVNQGPVPSHIEANDDDSLPNTFASPSKLSARRANLSLEHSRSATNLAQASEDAIANGDAGRPNGHAGIRPGGKQRRRSTMNWLNESPLARQKYLGDMVTDRMRDVWVSLHEEVSLQPFMITEKLSKKMNADFMSFDVSGLQKISRSESFTLKVWAEGGNTSGIVCVLELLVHMNGLEYIGKSLEDLAIPLTENAIIFHLVDGIYIDPSTRASFEPSMFQAPISRAATAKPVPTSSFDALMKLRDLTECIDDALQTRDAIKQQISSFIASQSADEATIKAATSASASRTATRDALGATSRELAKLRAQVQHGQASLNARRMALQKGLSGLENSTSKLTSIETSIVDLAHSSSANRPILTSQTRRVAQQLLTIFPIEPIPKASLCFTIAGLYLPSASIYESPSLLRPDRGPALHSPPAHEEETAAALGFACLALSQLSATLGIALPYTIVYRGSTSSIFDPITPATELGLGTSEAHKLADPYAPRTPETAPWRCFVLSQKASPMGKFTWGLFLLNRCVEEVSAKVGIRVVDPRSTAANLKVLLEALGTGEGGERRRGVVRGLTR